MAEVVGFGELLVDMVGDSEASLQDAPRFLKAPGGAPANVTVGLARLGVSSRFVGQVGRDPFGDFLSEVMAAEGVDIEYLMRSEVARTTLAFVATRDDGRKDICFYRNPGADAMLNAADIRPDLFDGARLFHCGSVSLSQSPCREAQYHAAEMARERGLLVSFDPNWRPGVWHDHELAGDLITLMMSLSDVVKIADEEWEFVTGTTDFSEGAEKIRRFGPRLIVVTKGENGAYFNAETPDGRTIEDEIAGFKMQAVDTLGAGDSFVAGLLSRLLQYPVLDDALNERSLCDAVRFANACGALATQKAGAIPSLPTHMEVEQFLRDVPAAR